MQWSKFQLKQSIDHHLLSQQIIFMNKNYLPHLGHLQVILYPIKISQYPHVHIQLPYVELSVHFAICSYRGKNIVLHAGKWDWKWDWKFENLQIWYMGQARASHIYWLLQFVVCQFRHSLYPMASQITTCKGILHVESLTVTICILLLTQLLQ